MSTDSQNNLCGMVTGQSFHVYFVQNGIGIEKADVFQGKFALVLCCMQGNSYRGKELT